MNKATFFVLIILTSQIDTIISANEQDSQIICEELFLEVDCLVESNCEWSQYTNLCEQKMGFNNFCEFDHQIECINTDLNEIEDQLNEILIKIKQSNITNHISNQSLLLIGNTGSGKSTVFNWITGAQFEIIQEQNTKQSKLIPIKNNNQVLSPQNGGVNSVTKLPQIVSYEEHTVIDFPGFSDTDGWAQQFFCDLMLLDLVTQKSIKLAYVLDHPRVEFQRRGMDIQNIITKLFQKHSVSYTSACLILNQYNDEDLEIQEVKKNVQNQLESISNLNQFKNNKAVFQAMKKDIFVISKVSIKNNNLHDIFNDQRKSEFWNIVKNMQPIQIEYSDSEHFSKVSEYLIEKGQLMILTIQNNMKRKQNCITNASLSKSILSEFEQLNQQKINQNQNKLLIYYDVFCKPQDKEQCYSQFINIYNNFYPYQKHIQAYQLLDQQFQQLDELVQISLTLIHAHQEREQIKLLIKEVSDTNKELKENAEIQLQQNQKRIQELEAQMYQLSTKSNGFLETLVVAVASFLGSLFLL